MFLYINFPSIKKKNNKQNLTYKNLLQPKDAGATF